MARKKRAMGGKAFEAKERNGEQEPGTFRKLDKPAKALELGTKTESDGFRKGGAAKRKDGGAIAGAASRPSLAKRARGGRTSAPFAATHSPKEREGASTSGHEGE